MSNDLDLQTVWTQSRTDRTSVLIWVQTVCRGHQQKTKVIASKERVKEVPFNEFSIWSDALNKLGMVLQYFKGSQMEIANYSIDTCR